jgi:hypothetical protein
VSWENLVSLVSSAINLVVSAFIGAVAWALIQWLIAWCRSPRLEIDFEESNGKKPYVHELTTILGEPGRPGTREVLGRYLRLSVKNKGRVPANGCIGKLTVKPSGKPAVPTALLLHWARNDPAIYKEPHQQFAPISIQRYDTEALDLLFLFRGDDNLQTHSTRAWGVSRNQRYDLEVTVFASNAKPCSKRIEFYLEAQSADELWDKFNTSGLRDIKLR